MKIKKIKIIILIFFILVAGVAIILFCFKDNTEEPVPTAVLDSANRAYVRLSLFNTMPDKISLEIPEDWEGNYRVKDNGNLVKIYYIKGVDGWDLLLFKQFDSVEWENNQDKDWQKAVENKKIVVAYKLSTGEDIGIEQMSKFNNMRADVSGLLKSIKLR